MIKVKNQKAVSRISYKMLHSNRVRNIIAIFAIALTTLLFTALFTIAQTIVHSFQQQNFRQVGSYFHGVFKDITEEQAEMLKKDSLISKSGARLILGMASDAPFQKTHVEVSYMDEIYADSSFCTPQYGELPKENSNEFACDTRILELLGVEPEIGKEITFSYFLGMNSPNQTPLKETFVLSGWWNYDKASMASMIVVPRSYAEQTLTDYTPYDEKDQTGKWALSVLLKNSSHIEENLEQILDNNGYTSKTPSADNFIDIGVNWGYINAQISNTADFGTVVSIIGLLSLITLTGYLIIYNIFQISVSNDIRFYGLLKTIGTTGRQIKSIILKQALLLSVVGIPAGLLLGYLVGNLLTPIVMSNLIYTTVYKNVNPFIFIGSSLFSLFTVYISCLKPGKAAAKVSPVEAVRYTEQNNSRKSAKRKTQKNSPFSMAIANLGRNRKKTFLVLFSLSLAIVLLEITVIFTNGFDMDKYLRQWVASDFIVGNADYFQVGRGIFSKEKSLSEDVIETLNIQNNITESGRIYGRSSEINQSLEEEDARLLYQKYVDKETLDTMLSTNKKNNNGILQNPVQIYGMEKFPLDHLTVIEGDLSDLYDPSLNAIAAVYLTDDYGIPQHDSNYAKVGDSITLYYGNNEEKTYTVAACVTMLHTMSYRYGGANYEFILNSEVFCRDSNTNAVMTYLFNTTEDSNSAVNDFLLNYTENTAPELSFESKQYYINEFTSLKSMFLVLGLTLSSIIAFVGILNFLNVVLTSIISRKQEFAMLQSIGMTGIQLKKMLIWEGLLYTISALLASLLLSIFFSPLMGNVMSSMFWFFSFQFTIWPVIVLFPFFLLIGAILPLVAYLIYSKQTIVERLREVE